MTSFKDYLIGKNYSQHTIQIHELNLESFQTWTEKENIESEQATHNEILSYIQNLKKRELKQSTIVIHLNSLKHFFTHLIKQDLREDNPIRNIKIKGVKRQSLHQILSKQELEQLYQDYPFETLNEKRNKVILGLIIWQGLGTSELGKLEEIDLKLREGKVYIKGARRSNERTLKLESTQIMDLMEYQFQVRPELAKNNPSDQLILNAQGGTTFQNIIANLLIRLKKQDKNVSSMNQLRTSVITYWLKNFNLRQVQYMAGHRYVSSSEAYQINDLDDLIEDIGKYHPIG